MVPEEDNAPFIETVNNTNEINRT